MIETISRTASTNTLLAERLRAGGTVREGHWLRAVEQTCGKGRAGRSWSSAPGNLYCSTVVGVQTGDPLPQTLSLVAGLGVHDLLREALSQTVPGSDAGRWLKWPNDVLIGGAKVAGILCERVLDTVIVGIGVNVASPPASLHRPTTSIAAVTGSPNPNAAEVLETLAPCFARRLHRWRTEPLRETLSEWESRAHPRGARLTVHDGPGHRISGRFGGLAEDGSLRLLLDDGSVHAIHAGDVEWETR
ncbi:biotin--[acetyl-CoA-carboxylase] ligase [Aurantiacibacter spongiae]|uniref:biotin--[biotin carboxyl-carrier protein] ligase n=1 Tax=Aurantiacibacter spongiae TaxID=2488860 RepID=A0A3N5CUS4_9SPHN|nr:biotin--[acetyl-CoA-carboxylase] ligase [Aurantiacibacter spongiae]RPF70369.1 biotin--[acetyl-CoA-carboxylase] ligase [Aurantiacibacter spongiae]